MALPLRVPFRRNFFSICGDEFADEEIFVMHAPVFGVDVERSVGFRRDDDKFAHLLLLPHIFNNLPAAAGDQKTLVAAKAMQKIKHWELLRCL